MEPSRGEYVIRYAVSVGRGATAPLWSGEPPAPIEPDYLAIAEAGPEGHPPDSWLLYFLKEDGTILECLQWESLEIALDQAASIAGLPDSQWFPCRMPVPETGVMPLRMIQGST